MDLSPLVISLKVSISATIISLVVAFFCIYLIKFKIPKIESFIEGLLMIPLVLPPSITGLALLIIFRKDSTIGNFLEILNIEVLFTIYGCIIASSIVSIPLVYRSIKTSVEDIDKTIFEEAMIVGCTNFNILKKIIIPLSKNGIQTGILLAFLRSLGEFGTTLMISGNIPGKTENIATTIYFNAISGNKKVALNWSIFLIVFSLFFIILINIRKEN